MATANLGRVKPVYQGVYNGGKDYVPLDFIKSGGLFYFNIAPCQGIAPPNATYWEPLPLSEIDTSLYPDVASAQTPDAWVASLLARLGDLTSAQPVVDLDFMTPNYAVGAPLGEPTRDVASVLTVTRATAAKRLNQLGKVVDAGIDEPRYEYDADNRARGLLVEFAATNYHVRSSDFQTADTESFNVVLTGSQPGHPDQSVDFTLVAADGSNADHGIGAIVAASTISPGSVVMWELDVAAAGEDAVVLSPWSGSDLIPGAFTVFDLALGTKEDVGHGDDSNYQSYMRPLGDGVWRVGIRFTWRSDSSGGAPRAKVRSQGSFVGDGFKGILMAEKNIKVFKTLSTAISTAGSSVTRGLDLVTMPHDPANFSHEKYTLFIEFEVDNFYQEFARVIQFYAGGAFCGLSIEIADGFAILYYRGASGYEEAGVGRIADTNGRSIKMAVSILDSGADNETGAQIISAANGVYLGVESTYGLASQPTHVRLGGDGVVVVRRLKVFPAKMSAAELIALTIQRG